MFDIKTLFKSFLGANTANGFVSYFANSYSADDGWKAYIIKGGPGTGKSSMMKQIAAVFGERGNDVEICPCSSDPDSLDAVIIHDKRVVIMDGTAPHTVEPKFPGVCETVVDLSNCWNDKLFSGSERQIISITRENKRLHAHAARYIKAAGELYDNNITLASGCLDFGKLKDYTRRLIGRSVKQGSGASERVRFLSGITPKGLVFLRGSVEKYYKTIIAVKDDYGAVSGAFMDVVRQELLSRSQQIIVCKNTILSDRIDHILVPKLSLAFCSENRYTHPQGITKRIHARRFINSEQLKLCRQKLLFNRRAYEELLREAISRIAEAKEAHDVLEKYYIDAMNFESVGEKTAKIIDEISKI